TRLRRYYLTSSNGLLDPPSHEKLSTLHDLFIVEPNVEIATDAVDMRLRRPICAGVVRVRMPKSDVNAGNFFVLQNIADHVRASSVGADGEFADPVAVLVGR